MSNLSPVDDLKNQIQIMKPQLKAALPPHIDVDKFARVVMTAIVTSPDLAKAQRQSFFGACLKAAADGLIPDGKEAALVTFKNGKTGEINVTYMPMLGGILKKVRNSGELSSITANIVHKNDKFVWFIDADGEHIQHNPIVFGDRGEPIGVYALAKTKDGGLYIEILDKKQIEAVRQSSKSKDYGLDRSSKKCGKKQRSEGCQSDCLCQRILSKLFSVMMIFMKSEQRHSKNNFRQLATQFRLKRRNRISLSN